MDFELSDVQRDIQRAAREFARGEFDPDLALELDQSGQFPESIWKKACQLGFIGIHYPEELGGQGLGFFETVLAIESFCRTDSGIGGALSTVDHGAEVILKFGSDEQKTRFLAPLTKGKKRLSIACSESEDGRDISSLSTVAERRSDGYLIHGRKKFVINVSLADAFIVLCKEPNNGWVTLISERETEGVEVRPIEKMGMRMIPFGDLHLKGVRIPYERQIGSDGEGLVQIRHHQQIMGLKSAALALGTSQGAFDQALQYVKQREQFGKRLSQFQVIRHKLADMAINIEVTRCLTYQSAAAYDQGRTDQEFLAMVQLEVGRRLISVVDEAVQIFGGYGYVAEQAIEHYFRDAWAIGTELGTEEELKDLICQEIFGPTIKASPD